MRIISPRLLWVSLVAALVACSSGGGYYVPRGDAGGLVDAATGRDGSSTPPDFSMKPTSCSNGIKDGNETDIDCGGGACPACADFRSCMLGRDCQSRVCNGQCAPPSCNDGVKNGFETDVDCGGPQCMKCADSRMCMIGSDCQSINCSNQLCCATGIGNCNFNGCNVDLTTSAANCGACGKTCPFNQTCKAGQCVVNGACTGVVGGPIAAVMGAQLNNYCWYLGTRGSACDQVCAAAGGSNQAVAAYNTLPDDCSGGGVGQPATWFFQNSNACPWTGPTGAPTGYHSLGHGYGNGTYYGRCSGVTAGTGTFPGVANNDLTRCTVCACSQ